MQKSTNEDLEPIDMVIVDADSMLYELACVSFNRKKNIVNFLAKLENVIASTQAREAYVYIKGKDNFRYLCTDDYKANRKDNLTEEQKESLAWLYEDAKEYCVESHAGEADDWCGIMAEYARDNGLSFVISHIDKDLNMLQGAHHNFRKNEFYVTDREYSYRFLMKQLLTGDAADNIKGLWKVGPVGAAKIVDAVPVDMVLDIVLDTWKSKSSLETFTKCANLIWIRDSVDDLRPLSFEELKERFTWNTDTDTGILLPSDPKVPLDSSISLPTPAPEGDTSEENNLQAAVAL